MKEWLYHLNADTPSISPFQQKWDQHQLVLGHSGLEWTAEVSNGGAHEVKYTRKAQRRRPRADANRTVSIGYKSQGDNKLVRIVTLTVPTLSLVDALLTESQKWDSETLINRQILRDEGPWRGTDMTVAWDLYFQAQDHI